MPFPGALVLLDYIWGKHFYMKTRGIISGRCEIYMNCWDETGNFKASLYL